MTDLSRTFDVLVVGGGIVTELMRLGREAGHDGFFIFTRPATSPAFESLGFKRLVAHGKAVLLEYGNELHHYLRKRATLMHSGESAAVVISADPFTKGHDYLIEHIARSEKTVYVFVPGEGSFVFPLDVRLELARRGTAHLKNVIVTDFGPYRLSAATFPTYFLGVDDQPDRIRIEIEVDLFGKHIAPAFHIRTRVSGTEPLDPVARLYNQIMRERLARWDIRFLEIERKKSDDLWINVKRVHKALAAGDMRSLEAYLPETILVYLQTPEATRFIGK
jgi:[citrate (pro-3S)-lyase] ligase